MPIIDGLARFQNPAPTGLAAIGSKVPFIIPGESVNATLVLKDALPQCYCCFGMFCGFDTSTQPELFPVKSLDKKAFKSINSN